MAYAVYQKDGDERPISGVPMKPKPNPKTHQQPMLGTMRLDLAIDMDHELVRLAQSNNLDAITTEFHARRCRQRAAQRCRAQSAEDPGPAPGTFVPDSSPYQGALTAFFARLETLSLSQPALMPS